MRLPKERQSPARTAGLRRGDCVSAEFILSEPHFSAQEQWIAGGQKLGAAATFADLAFRELLRAALLLEDGAHHLDLDAVNDELRAAFRLALRLTDLADDFACGEVKRRGVSS